MQRRVSVPNFTHNQPQAEKLLFVQFLVDLYEKLKKFIRFQKYHHMSKNVLPVQHDGNHRYVDI